MWVQLVGSLVAILLLAGLARLLGLGAPELLTPDRAREEAEAALAGFVAGRSLVATDGRTALVEGRHGTIAVLKLHGAKVAVRRLVAPLTLVDAPEGVTVLTGEKLFGAVTLTGVYPDDARALVASLAMA